MKKLLLITAILTTGCALEAPAETQTTDLWNQGYDACLADDDTDADYYRKELELCEFFLEDERSVADARFAEYETLINNLHQKIQILERENDCEDATDN